ncbi:MAG: hypothetical protein V3S69_04865 [Dehalococcoidales bacterium]
MGDLVGLDLEILVVLIPVAIFLGIAAGVFIAVSSVLHSALRKLLKGRN